MYPYRVRNTEPWTGINWYAWLSKIRSMIERILVCVTERQHTVLYIQLKLTLQSAACQSPEKLQFSRMLIRLIGTLRTKGGQ